MENNSKKNLIGPDKRIDKRLNVLVQQRRLRLDKFQCERSMAIKLLR